MLVLLSRVPYSFLLLSGIFAVTLVIGILMVSEPKDGENQQSGSGAEQTFSLTPLQVVRTLVFYQVRVG